MAKKRQRALQRFSRATKNSTERTTNLRKHKWNRTRSTLHVQKRARKGHSLRGRRTCSGIRRGRRTIPTRTKKRRMRQVTTSSRRRTLSGGGHGWGNENAPASAPCTLGIPGGAAGSLTKHATKSPAEGNEPRIGTTAQ